MLSYQHGYHAGNFADVHKHTALFILLDLLGQSDQLVTYIDCHSGRGLYDLENEQAQKTGEAQAGIKRFDISDIKNNDLKAYLAFTTSREDQLYPGSPALIQKFMKPNDRAVFFELHPTEFEQLQSNFAGDQRLRLLHENSYERLMDYLPARNKAGLVLIDPSYEVKDDYETVARLVKNAAKRAKETCFMIWYPMLAAQRHEGIKAILKDALYFEFVDQNKDQGMWGTGLALVNPPIYFKERFTATIDEMKAALLS